MPRRATGSLWEWNLRCSAEARKPPQPRTQRPRRRPPPPRCPRVPPRPPQAPRRLSRCRPRFLPPDSARPQS
ncbi:hypothetical protein FFF93_015630 [Arthrobacter sp. KBS0702]|nr:hypothetical protein FFF93_015630 [Arthrobacter sp. KBS0702]